MDEELECALHSFGNNKIFYNAFQNEIFFQSKGLKPTEVKHMTILFIILLTGIISGMLIAIVEHYHHKKNQQKACSTFTWESRKFNVLRRLQASKSYKEYQDAIQSVLVLSLIHI